MSGFDEFGISENDANALAVLRLFVTAKTGLVGLVKAEKLSGVDRQSIKAVCAGCLPGKRVCFVLLAWCRVENTWLAENLATQIDKRDGRLKPAKRVVA